MSFEKCLTGGKAPKVQRSCCTPRWFCWSLCSIHRTRIVSISNDSRQNHGYHLQTARLRWTSSRRSISSYPGIMGKFSQILNNSKIGMSRHLGSSTTTQMAYFMVQYGRSSRPHWAKSFGRTYGKGNFEEILLKYGWEGSQLGMLIRTPWEKGYSYLCMWKPKNWLEKQNLDPMWKLLNKEVGLGEPTSFLDHVYLGCTQRQCEISKDIVDN